MGAWILQFRSNIYGTDLPTQLPHLDFHPRGGLVAMFLWASLPRPRHRVSSVRFDRAPPYVHRSPGTANGVCSFILLACAKTIWP